MFRAVGVRALLFCCALLVPMLSQPYSPLVAGDPASSVAYPLPYRVNGAQASFDLEIVVLNLINQERLSAGLAPLMPHATMRTIARAHGTELFGAGVLSHRSLDGRTPQQRVLDQHVRVRLVGENLAYAPDVQTAHDALMASSPHRQNILSSDYALVGIAVLHGGAYGVIIVQNFSDAPFTAWARPLSRPGRRPTAFVPRNRAASDAGWPPAHEERRPVH
ncbi:MAG: CAP domain-containing protein [Armatimonadota bacterium]